jgi:hypothetical protein
LFVAASLPYTGSPIGASVAYLLLQHKAELGVKHVPSITIFRDAGEGMVQPQLLFTIEDVADPDSDVEMPDAADSSNVRRSVEVRQYGKNVLRVHEFRMAGGKVEAGAA